MIKRLKIVADENMPGLQSLFSDIADIKLAKGREISKDTLLGADALLCRSITKANSLLLANSKIQFVGTATIGTDHLDIDWLNQNKITWTNAAGCNAPAVGQYVLSAIAYWCLNSGRAMKELTVGIIGAGNVGTVLAKYLELLGINYKLCDPPLQEKGDKRSFDTLDSILNCNVISIHVPLIEENYLTNVNNHPTHYLISKSNLKKLRDNQLLINASRGAVINNQDLDDYLKTPNAASIILDVFENEPNVRTSLVKNCLLATPHIAGHTLEGNLRGSWLVYLAFCKRFGIKVNKQEFDLYPNKNTADLSNLSLEKSILVLYDIFSDSKQFQELADYRLAQEFDHLRKNAVLLSSGVTRRDYNGWNIENDSSNLQYLK